MTGSRLAIEGLSCMAGLRPLFHELTLQLPAGQWVALTGPNGTGKSTLLRAIAGLIRPSAGRLLWDGQPVRTTSLAWRQTVFYQGHAPALKDSLSCAENLTHWLALDHGRMIDKITVDSLLSDVGLARCRDLPAISLSAGQRRRVQLARMAATHGRALWLLDEPGNALDANGLTVLHGLVDRHLAAGGCAIVATHLPLHLASPALSLDMPRFAFTRQARPRAVAAATP